MSLSPLVDLVESYSGDLVLTASDFADTSSDVSQTYSQLVRTILATPPGDCSLFRNMGFNGDVYEGATNNELTGRDLGKAIGNAIVTSTNLYPSQVTVVVFPIGTNSVACRLVLNPIDQPLQEITTLYDTSDKMIKSFVFADGSPATPTTINITVPPVINSRA